MKLLTLSLFLAVSCLAETLTGKVVSVYDGDTITVLEGTTQHKIRFEGIDTPESKQPFGTRAKQAMSKMVFGKEVRVEWSNKDRYGRTLGHVYVNGMWTNLEMIQQGMAWHYKQYSKDQRLAKAEIKAKESKLGIWSAPNAIAPWDWRKGKRSPSPEQPKKLKLLNDKAPTFVYITNTGKKYHGPNCRYLKDSMHKVTFLSIQGKGMDACKVCRGK